MRKRIFSLILTCVVLCTCVFGTFVAASAESYPSWSERLDWTQVDYSVRYGNESNIVTIPLSSQRYVVAYMQPNANRYEQMIIGQEESRIVFQTSDEYRIDIFPASSFGLTTDSLPTGAVFSCDVTLWFASEEPVNVYPASLYSGCYYLDENGRQFNFYYDDVGTEYTFGNTVSFSFPIEYVDNSVGVVPRISIRDFTTYTEGIYYITIHNPKLTMEVSTDFWNSFENRLNGQKIDQVNDTLNDQWNAGIESEKPVGSDKVESADKAESEVRDNAQSGLDKGNELQSNASNILKSDDVVVAFACVAKLFELFADISFFSDLLTISVALGIFSLLVNLANSVSAWNRRETAKAEREQRRQEASERYSRRKH